MLAGLFSVLEKVIFLQRVDNYYAPNGYACIAFLRSERLRISGSNRAPASAVDEDPNFDAPTSDEAIFPNVCDANVTRPPANEANDRHRATEASADELNDSSMPSKMAESVAMALDLIQNQDFGAKKNSRI